ncbi:MAG: preprotein translocase subunit SecG [bacterium]|nr:preprotein translocase subunit SecG [bacterium]
MQFLVSILPYAQIVLAVLLVGGILLQQRGAGMGGAFGGGDGFGYNTRRGAEKIFFQASILIALLFVLSTVLNLIIK